MGTRAEEMIRVALDSFARAQTLERAESLVDLDELIDRANRRVVAARARARRATPSCASGACG